MKKLWLQEVEKQKEEQLVDWLLKRLIDCSENHQFFGVVAKKFVLLLILIRNSFTLLWI